MLTGPDVPGTVGTPQVGKGSRLRTANLFCSSFIKDCILAIFCTVSKSDALLILKCIYALVLKHGFLNNLKL